MQARLGYACPAGVPEQRPNFLFLMHAPHWGARRARQERGQWTPGRSLAQNRWTGGALTPSSTGAKRPPQGLQSQLLPVESSRPSLALFSPTLVHCPSLQRRASPREIGAPAAAEPGVAEALAARPCRGRDPFGVWPHATDRHGLPRSPPSSAWPAHLADAREGEQDGSHLGRERRSAPRRVGEPSPPVVAG